MPIQPSLRRRRISSQTARLSQPLAWPASFGLQPLLLNNTGSSMTASATANTAGAFVQYIASNAIAATDTISALHIQGTGNNQSNTADNSMLLDIATGASGAEVIIAEGIAVGGLQNSAGFGPLFTLPILIPGATRVACRVRAATGSRVLTMTQLWASGSTSRNPFADRLPTSVDVLGTNSATSTGTAMSGGSGTWTQIVASTSRDYQALLVVPSGPFSGATTAVSWRLDLGVGAAGAEVPLAYYRGNISSTGAVGIAGQSASTLLAGGFFPAGTRIAVRHDLASNPERLCACVIGVPYV